MQVKDVMTKEVIAVTIDTDIKDVANILTEKRIHGVPVIDNEKKVIGIVTETNFFSRLRGEEGLSDFVKNIKENKLPDVKHFNDKNEIESITKVENIMTKNCTTVSVEMDITELFEIFRKKGYHTIPVANKDGVLEGIVTIADIISISAKLS